MDLIGITIVIPAYNEEKFLPATLNSVNLSRELFSRTTGIPTEVIVVDNSSTDKTALVADDHQALVISHDIRNISSVRNAGIRKASYSLIVAIDADCSISPDSLVKIWNFMKDDRFLGAALGVKIHSSKALNRVMARWIQSIVASTSGIYGAMFVFRKHAAMAVGGFPEDRFVAEDSVFAIAMRRHAKKSGKKFGILRSVVVETLDRKETKLRDLPALAVQIIAAFLGVRQDAEDLKYWYKPRR
jgi:glycosyltransferase involved in cell wall biosynthesis